jgi:hypothetical protein
MSTIDATLRGALSGAGDALTLTLDPVFQGLPDTAHGGSVLGLFDVLAGRGGPRTLRGRYLRRVPLGSPLVLTLTREAHALRCRVAELGGASLVEGDIAAADPVDADALRDAPLGSASDARPLPVSLTCFACGIENPQGLGAQLTADARTVAGAWAPPPQFRGDDGRLATVALTTLLDEAAFWLGALASGESGMTTELLVTLHGDAHADGRVHIRGERGTTRARADDPRYWDTRVGAYDERGRPLATAAITFVAVRGAARRLVTGMLAMNPPEVVRRAFPAYCA